MNSPFASPDPRMPASMPRPRPGAGTRLTVNSMGFALGAPQTRASFAHPWRPSLGSNTIRLTRGLVDGRTPTIGGRPMTAAELPIRATEANEAGESWVCVEVAPDAARGIITKDSRVELVHAAVPILFDKTTGRHPLVSLLWQGGRVAAVHQVTYFNLQYQRIEPVIGLARHLFF